LDQLSLDVVSGNGQTGVVGTELAPLIVKVTSGGNPVSLQVLNFRVVSGGGSVYGGTELTDDHGIAQEIWTLGTNVSTPQRVEVRAVESSTGAEKVFGVFTATALSGPAAKLAFVVQPAAVEGSQTITPAVQVAIEDAFGNTVTTAATGVIVALGTNPSEGTLSGTTTVTASGGLATFATLSVDRPGAGYTLAATASGLVAATSAAFHVGLTFAAVSTGFTHTCGVTTPGAAYCWGDNSSGQLGDGTTATRLSPVLVQGGLHFAAVSAGAFYTCGLTTSGGAAYCWGDNSQNGGGELGDGTFTDRTSPVAVLGGLSFAAVKAGNGHTCGVTTTHIAYCWGDNLFGELGDGTITPTSKPSPVAVAGGLDFLAVSAGGPHSCGLTTAHVAYCWGDNSFGELGDGTMTSSPTPVAAGRPTPGAGTWASKASMPTARNDVTGAGVGATFYAVGGKTGNTCAGLKTLEAYDPATDTWAAKAAMPTGRFNPGATALGGLLYVVGGDVGCGARSGAVEVYDPTTNTWTTRAPMPTARTGPAVVVVNGVIYALSGIAGNSVVTTVEAFDPVTDTWTARAPMLAGCYKAMAGVVNGIIYSVCGSSADVEAYDPASNTWTSKTPMPITISEGQGGTLNGILLVVGGPDAEAYDPGSDTWTKGVPMPTSRLRFGTGVVNGILYAVGGGPDNPVLATLEAFTPTPAISFMVVSPAGGHYSCGVATDAVTYCWGRNTFGQLGDGISTYEVNPTPVVGGLTFAVVSAGGRFGGGFGHACGITTIGSTYCWGQNASGQLGDATTSDHASPVSVFGGVTFAAVSASVFHTCGVTMAGAVYCWGQNDSGRLGDGTTNSSSVPVRAVQ